MTVADASIAVAVSDGVRMANVTATMLTSATRERAVASSKARLMARCYAPADSSRGRSRLP